MEELWLWRGEERECTYVAARHDPILDDDVFGVPAVEAVGVDSGPLGVGSGVHVEVGHCDVLGVGDEGVPIKISHLFLDQNYLFGLY